MCSISMAFHWTLSPIRFCSLSPKFAKNSVPPLVPRLVCLLSQTNRQSERTNQELEAALWYVVSSKTTWSSHNSMNSMATVSISGGELIVISVQHRLRFCSCLWRATRAALLRTQEQSKCLEAHHLTSAPDYLAVQKVWLLLKMLH